MSADRESVIRRIRGLETLAEQSSFEEERQSARELAAKLKAKHGVSDDDLIEHEGIGGLFEGMFAGFRWGRVVRDEVDRIWGEVDALVDRMIAEEKGVSRAEAVNAVFGRVRSKLGDDADPDQGTLKFRRDEALYDYFVALDRADKKQRAEYEEPEEDAETANIWEQFRLGHIYERVAHRVKTDGASLNKTQVEKIVKRVRKRRADEARRARERAVMDQPCHFCGVEGDIEVEKSEPVRDRKVEGGWRTVYYQGRDTTYPRWIDHETVVSTHTSCWQAAQKESA